MKEGLVKKLVEQRAYENWLSTLVISVVENEFIFRNTPRLNGEGNSDKNRNNKLKLFTIPILI
jgi:hypothetical protein